MTRSCLYRPLLWIAAAAIGAIWALDACGFWVVTMPKGFSGRRAIYHAELRVISPLKQDRRGGSRFFARILYIDSHPVFAHTKILVVSRAGLTTGIRPGMKIMATGLLRPPRPARNPGDFDEYGWLNARGVGAILQAAQLRIVPAPIQLRYQIDFWAEATRQSLQSCLSRALSRDDAALMQGILLGNASSVSHHLFREVQDAGGMHLLAPSGAKVAFILWVVFSLTSALSTPPLARAVVAALAGGFYTVMVGADPPYERACFGAVSVFLARLIDRETDLLHAAIMSSLIILLIEPRDALTAGFVMTYAAVLVLAAAVPLLKEGVPVNWKSWAKSAVFVIASSVVVQLALWPTFACYFHRGSLIGAVANIFLIPLAAVLMAAGLSVWGASLGGVGLVGLVAHGTHLACGLFRWLCMSFSSLPWAAIDLTPMHKVEIAAWYVLLAAILAAHRRRIAVAMGVLSVILWTLTAWLARPVPVRIILLHMPRGQTALISLSGKEHWLIGAEAPAATVLRALAALHISRLDKIVILGSDVQERRALARVRAAIPVSAVETARRTWTWCRNQVCLDMGGDQGPRLRRGDGEFSIIPIRLKKGALKVITDGLAVSISYAVE